jgi:hypothetical protein
MTEIEFENFLVGDDTTYNSVPSKSILAGMWMSEKKFTLTANMYSLATQRLSELVVNQDMPRIPCSVQLEILPVIISPLKGRNTTSRNSTILLVSSAFIFDVGSKLQAPLTLTKPSPWPISPSDTLRRSYMQMQSPIFWITW